MTRKLFWEKPYQIEFKAKVIEIHEHGLILDETLFHPFGGAQLSDIGVLSFNNESYKVINVTKENEKIIHHLNPSFKEKIKVGDNLSGKIDWEHRYGIMKGHTSQHILSAYFMDIFDIETGEVQIHPEDVTLHLKKKISLDQLEDVIKKANQTSIRENIVVKPIILPYQDANKRYSGKTRGKIPKNDFVRIIEIEGLDLICCGGAHVSQTVEIGPIFIYKFNRGMEIKYFVGKKAIEAISEFNIRLIKSSDLLNKPLLVIDEAIERNSAEISSLRQLNKDMTIKIMEELSKSPGEKIKNVSVNVLEFPLNQKLVTAGFNRFPINSLLIVRLNPLMLMFLSSCSDINAKDIILYFNQKFGGKGGGNPKVAQGKLEKEPKDIMKVIKEFLNNQKW